MPPTVGRQFALIQWTPVWFSMLAPLGQRHFDSHRAVKSFVRNKSFRDDSKITSAFHGYGSKVSKHQMLLFGNFCRPDRGNNMSAQGRAERRPGNGFYCTGQALKGRNTPPTVSPLQGFVLFFARTWGGALRLSPRRSAPG